MLHKVYHGYSILFLDLEKKVMEDVLLVKNDAMNLTFVPYEMDMAWSSLFSGFVRFVRGFVLLICRMVWKH